MLDETTINAEELRNDSERKCKWPSEMTQREEQYRVG
jgi:hypothetical protein